MDFTKLKKLTIGGVELKQLFINGVQAWKAITFTNQVPISTDTDGSIFNGVGYKDNVRLSSTSGGISSSAQNNSVTTGFIPFHGDGDVIRLKGVEFVNVTDSGKHYYFVFYDANKKTSNGNNYFSSGNLVSGVYSHIITATRDENGVETIVFNKEYGTSNSLLQWIRSASYVRITAKGKGADMIVTINEEIT